MTYLYGEEVNQDEAAHLIAMLMLVGAPAIGVETTLKEAGRLVIDGGALIMFPSSIKQTIELRTVPDGWICPDDDTLDGIIELYREYGEPGLSYLEVVQIAYNIFMNFVEHKTPVQDKLAQVAEDFTSLYALVVKAA